MASNSLKSTIYDSKMILCTYEYLPEDPLEIYSKLHDKLCLHGNYFTFFVIFSNDILTTKILMRLNSRPDSRRPSRFSMNHTIISIEKVTKNVYDLCELIPLADIQFDFDMQYHRFLINNGIPVEMPETDPMSYSNEYINAKIRRINEIKADSTKRLKKYQNAIKQISELMPDLYAAEEKLLSCRMKGLENCKKDKDINSILIERNSELRKKIFELENIITVDLQVKRMKNSSHN